MKTDRRIKVPFEQFREIAMPIIEAGGTYLDIILAVRAATGKLLCQGTVQKNVLKMGYRRVGIWIKQEG